MSKTTHWIILLLIAGALFVPIELVASEGSSNSDEPTDMTPSWNCCDCMMDNEDVYAVVYQGAEKCVEKPDGEEPSECHDDKENPAGSRSRAKNATSGNSGSLDGEGDDDGTGGRTKPCYTCCKGEKREIPCPDQDPCEWMQEGWPGKSRFTGGKQATVVCDKDGNKSICLIPSFASADKNDPRWPAIECLQLHEQTHLDDKEHGECPTCWTGRLEAKGETEEEKNANKIAGECEAYQAQLACLPEERKGENELITRHRRECNKYIEENCKK